MYHPTNSRAAMLASPPLNPLGMNTTTAISGSVTVVGTPFTISLS